MKTKVCKQCGKLLPLEDFYINNSMSDGHFNKCKECIKSNVHANYLNNLNNPEYVEKERKRGREKYYRLGYVERKSRTMKMTNHGSARNISRDLRKIGVNLKKKECHHWNYNFPKSVFVMSRRAHKRIHKHLSLDMDSGVMTFDDGTKILTPDQAMVIYKKIFEIEGINEGIEFYDITDTPITTN